MRPRILFVDDHADTRELLLRLLQRWGYEGVPANGVGEALKAAREQAFDLYLLDHKFEDGSGADLCAAIREFDLKTPIVFYSGDHPSRLKEALECDAQGFVMKPGFDALPGEIERALNKAA